MDWTFKLGDFAIVVATVAGPVLAVQAQKWVERSRERHESRVRIFRVLMSTRRSILSQAYVEALNIVPIEFYGKKAAFVDVVNAWKTYIDHLYKEIVDNRAWGEKRVELLNTMLMKMSAALGYNFNMVEISRELYSPKGHAAIEGDQEIIRRGLASLFKGEIALPMDVKSFPADPQIIQSQREFLKLFSGWLEGQQSVKVTVAKEREDKSSL